jgi:hypothetical protein
MGKAMASPGQETQVKRDKPQHGAVPATVAETAASEHTSMGWPIGPITAGGGDLIEAQAARLSNPRLHGAQRQALAMRIGRVQGNRHLQRVVASLGREGEMPDLTPASQRMLAIQRAEQPTEEVDEERQRIEGRIERRVGERLYSSADLDAISALPNLAVDPNRKGIPKNHTTFCSL